MTPTREEALAHFGVKGMKWGVRKKQDDSPNASYTPSMQKNDLGQFGKRGVKRINRRMNAGMTRLKAQDKEHSRQANISLAIAGGVLATRLLIAYGPMLMSAISKSGMKIRTKAAVNRMNRSKSDRRGISSKVSKTPYIKKNFRGVYNITTM